MLLKALRKLESEALLVLPPSAVTRLLKLDSSCDSVESPDEDDVDDEEDDEDVLLPRLAVSLLMRLCRSLLIWPGPPPPDDPCPLLVLVPELDELLCACRAAIRLCMKLTMAEATDELELSDVPEVELPVLSAVVELEVLVEPVVEVSDDAVLPLTLSPRLASACMTEPIMPPPPPEGGGPGGGPMGADAVLLLEDWVLEVDCNCDSHA